MCVAWNLPVAMWTLFPCVRQVVQRYKQRLLPTSEQVAGAWSALTSHLGVGPVSPSPVVCRSYSVPVRCVPISLRTGPIVSQSRWGPVPCPSPIEFWSPFSRCHWVLVPLCLGSVVTQFRCVPVPLSAGPFVSQFRCDPAGYMPVPLCPNPFYRIYNQSLCVAVPLCPSPFYTISVPLCCSSLVT